MNQEKYRLVVPPMDHFQRMTVSGPLGVRPDTGILFDPDLASDLRWHTCQRTRLPRNISTFRFVDRGELSKPKPLKNFYCLNEFLIVDAGMLEFLLKEPGQEVEFKTIKPQLRDGSHPLGEYYAAKVTRTLDCIDPDTSSIHSSLWNAKEEKPLSEMVFTCDLSDECAEEYSNAGYGKYRSFPGRLQGMTRLQLKENSIPTGAALFQPLYWPGHLIGESAFLKSLAAKCTGGTPGYYFWALDLSDVGRSYRDTCTAMR
jgi:hypothetical protein